MGKKPGRKAVIVAVVATLAVMATAAVAVFDYYRTFHRSNVVEVEGEQQPALKVYRSYNFEQLCDAVAQSGAVADMELFRRAAKHMKLGESITPGYYRLTPGMNNKAVVRMIANGWQEPVKVSFTGYIRSLERFSKILSDKFEADSASFAKVLLDTAVMTKYGFEKESFIGMFIPNTYEFYWTVTPEDFVERMNKEYDSFWNASRRNKAADMGLTRKEVSTLAAIVIEESKYEPEMPRIAGVYMNRLRKGIRLQADPTVKYALNMKGITRILNRHLKVDSPYNTYVYKGLPPGPITMPPVVALDAVLDYEHHNYIYFCARETFDGQHNFASTMLQHLENARRYHRAYEQWDKARKAAAAQSK